MPQDRRRPGRFLPPARACYPAASSRGAVAQLGERLNGIQEVDGSIPFSSTRTFSPELNNRPGRRDRTIDRPPGGSGGAVRPPPETSTRTCRAKRGAEGSIPFSSTNTVASAGSGSAPRPSRADGSIPFSSTKPITEGRPPAVGNAGRRPAVTRMSLLSLIPRGVPPPTGLNPGLEIGHAEGTQPELAPGRRRRARLRIRRRMGAPDLRAVGLTYQVCNDYGSILNSGWCLRKYTLIAPSAMRLPARTAGQDNASRISAAKTNEMKRNPERKMTEKRMTPNP